MNHARSAAADIAFSNYNFGPRVIVEEASGWESSTASNEWTRPVFIQPDTDEARAPSVKVTFVVRFAPESAVVEEQYAITDKGTIFGTVPDQGCSKLQAASSDI